MSPRSVHEYADRLRSQYLTATREAKGRLLTEFCRITGYHRKAAIRVLRRQIHPSAGRRGRPRRYCPAVAEALRHLWEVSDHLCAKRLAPFLPELIRVLERQRELRLSPAVRGQLLTVSAPTIDRLLRPFRRRTARHLTGGLPAVSSLRAQVPIRTFGEWHGVQPGAIQADLAYHCGESVAGFHLASLLTVDVATGWTECQPVWGLSFQRVGTAVHRARTALPFPLRQLHTDNGSEFLNNILVPWCRREGIYFTRGRPWKKNDQAYAEQKVWAVVRRLIGYDRYSTRAAYDQLARIYTLVGLYINFFQPTAKLVQKIRRGPRVTKRYDRAQTPYQRLLAAKILTPAQQAALENRYLTLNPRRLRDELQEALTRLWKLADQPRPVTAVMRQPPRIR